MQLQSVREPLTRPRVTRESWLRHADSDGEGTALAMQFVQEPENELNDKRERTGRHSKRQFTSNPGIRQYSSQLTRTSRLIGNLRLADDALLTLGDIAKELAQALLSRTKAPPENGSAEVLPLKNAFQEKEREVEQHLMTFQYEAGFAPAETGPSTAAPPELDEQGGDMSATFEKISEQRGNISAALRELEKSVKRSVWERYNSSNNRVLDNEQDADAAAEALSHRIDSVRLSAMQAQANLDAALVLKLLEIN